MKILVIHTAYTQKGGEDSVVANEIALLQSIGEEVKLLQFHNSTKQVLKLLQLPFNYFAYKETKAKLQTFQPDIVHIHNLHFAGSAAVIYALKKTKIPFVITLHNYRLLCPSGTLFHNNALFLDSISKPFPWKAVLLGVYHNSRIITFWISFTMAIHHLLGTWELASKYIILGQQTKDVFINSKLHALSKKMIIKPNFCYNGVTTIQYKREYYLYLGRLSEEKGLMVLLQAFAKNGLPITIAGTGPVANEVKKYSDQYPNIKFLGSVNSKLAYELIASAIALIFPSLWYETFGMVIIEAFSAGTPVITSNIGQAKYLINDRHNGLHFIAGDVLDLQKKVMYYENLSEEKRMAYQNNALISYRKKYSPEKNAAQLLSVYSQAIVQQM